MVIRAVRHGTAALRYRYGLLQAGDRLRKESLFVIDTFQPSDPSSISICVALEVFAQDGHPADRVRRQLVFEPRAGAVVLSHFQAGRMEIGLLAHNSESSESQPPLIMHYRAGIVAEPAAILFVVNAEAHQQYSR